MVVLTLLFVLLDPLFVRFEATSDVRFSIAPIVLAGLLTAAGTATAAGINAASNAYSNKQNQKNWEKQNEYNSPTNQMARYRAAGLNPNLIYGSGQASAGQAGAIAPYQGFQVDGSDVLSMANALASVRNMEANTRKAEAEALAANLDNTYKSTTLQYYGSSLDLDNQLRRANLAYRSGQIDQLGYQKAVLQAQAQNLVEQALYNKYNRTTLQPQLLQLRRQSVANETRLTKSRLESMFTERVGARTRNSLLGKELQYYDDDRLLNRRSKGLGAAASALGSLTGFGRFYDDYQYRHSWWNY